MSDKRHYNFTDVGLLFKNEDGPGYSGPVTTAAPIMLAAGNVQLLLKPHRNIEGAMQLTAMRESPRKTHGGNG